VTAVSKPETGAFAFRVNGAEIVDGYACPIDPQDLLDCESCQ
jgi:hypothetical protein